MDLLQWFAAGSSSSSGSPYMILLPVALILFAAKGLSVLLDKIHIPHVIGFLLAGLLVGALKFIPSNPILSDYVMDGINILAKFGVVMILFSAGLETDLKQIKSVGGPAIVITSLGVIVPMGFGFLAAYLFRVYGGLAPDFYSSLEAQGINPIYSDLYYGIILSATSVSITVATLKELGKLETRECNAIVAAAIIDDIIGIVLLSLAISLSGSTASGSDINLLGLIITACGGSVTGGLSIVVIILNMTLFFLISFGVSFLVKKIFNHLGSKYPHHIRIPIFSFAFCFLWAYLAQTYFQIADITGGYIAGLILSSTAPREYIDHRTETTMDVFFVPVFFASVAMKMYSANFDFSSLSFVWFGLTWVAVGLLGKVIGAGGGGLMTKFGLRKSLIIGIGMMARAEVLIVTAQTGVDAGLVSDAIIPFTLGLILISSFLTPILLKFAYKNELPSSPSRGGPSPDEAKEELPSTNSSSPKAA